MNNYINKKFDNYKDMTKSALNWNFDCNYQLLPIALKGEHNIINLSKMQLSYSYREGGMMYGIKAPKDTISIAVIDECEDRALYDRLKLKKGYIVFFDDSKEYIFMSHGYIKVSIVSIKIDSLGILSDNIRDYIDHYIKDNSATLSTTLNSLLIDFKNGKDIDNTIQNTIINIIKDYIDNQAPQKSKLTYGEDIALNVVKDMINHMDGKIDISAIAYKYNVSKQTLQNSFRSLFGFSAKKFLLLLKLNHVHNDLYHSTTKNITVLVIATKWGFSHMGNFARYYKELFHQTPSQTLKNNYDKIDMMDDRCVLRKEEII